jgi:glycosyltransferase 2 family protein
VDHADPGPAAVTDVHPTGVGSEPLSPTPRDGGSVAPTVAAVALTGRRSRLFAPGADQPRSRRATDVIQLAAAGVGLVFLGAVAEPLPRVERAFMVFVRVIPSGLDGLWRLFIGLLQVFAAFLLIAMAYRRRWAMLRDIIIAALVAFTVSVIVGRLAVGSWPAVWDSLRSVGASPYFPPLAVTVPTAVVVTALPHMSKSARRVGRWLVVLGLIGVVLHQTATPSGAVAGLLVATVGAAAVHLIFWSSMGRPSLDDVASALTRLGVGAHGLGVAKRQSAGVFLVDAVDDTGQPLVIKVYGRDAHDTQLLATAWRTVWYREAGSPTSFGRLQQAEHEAFLTLLAAQSEIPTQRVVTASATPENDVILVLRTMGAPLSEMPDRWTAELVGRAWATLGRLHQAGIAHGQLDDQHLFIERDRVGLIDFRGAALSPRPERLRTDEAQLLVTTVLGIGAPAALDAALAALGPDGVTAALPFVQLTALTARQRLTVGAATLDLDELREQASERLAITAPELVQMRRVTFRSVLQIALLVVAFLALVSAVSGLDWEQLAEQVRDATWWLVAAGVLIAQAPRLTSAISVMGASPTPLPLAPVYALQLATSYISLAVPTSAARIAVNIRFFQRHGLPAGAALAIGGLDSLGQFAVQLVLLVGILLLTSATLELSLDGAAPSGLIWLVAIVFIAAAAATLALVLVPKWRRFVLGWIQRLWRDAVQAARGLQSPRRLGMLIGGNLATEVLFAVALQTFARSLGYQIGLAELVLINVSVSLLSGLIPIPGGIGVVEGGLTLGLVRAGMPEEAAFAAVLLYRLATFYLPPIWGFFAIRWLERNKHL